MKRAWIPFCLLASCGSQDAPVAEDSATGPAPSALHFVDGTATSGLGAFQQRNGSADKNLIHESFAAGLALVDLNGDGQREIFVTISDGEQGAQVVVYSESGINWLRVRR